MPSCTSYFNALVIDPVSPTILYAGTELNGAFKSIDAGENWREINTGLINGLTLHHSVNALAIDPITSTTIYAGTEEGVFKSIDGGNTWNAVGSSLTKNYISALVLDPTTSIIFLGTPHGVFAIQQ